MPAFFSRLRLRWKIVLLALGLHAALGTSFALTLSYYFTILVERKLEEFGSLVTLHLAEQVVDPFLLNDQVRLQRLLEQTLALESDIAYVFIAAKGGVPLVHTFQGGFPKALLTAHLPEQNEGVRMLPLATEQGIIHDFAAPLLKGRDFYLHIGFSEAHLIHARDASRKYLLLIVTGFGVIGFGVALALAAVITRPLALLGRAVEEIGQGRFDRKVPVTSRDELGQLAGKFNEMSDSLAGLLAEREQSAQAQKETLALLQSIADGIGEGIMLLDPDYKVVWANKYVLEQHGTDLEAIRNTTCHQITHGRPSPCLDFHDSCPIALQEGGGRPVTLEHSHLDRKGKPSPVEVSVYPLRDEQGRIYQYLHISRDIRERLERVRLEEQLRHSQKMEAIGRLSGGMAHDFNNILTAIVGFSELGMLRVKENDPLRDNFHTILEAGKRGRELTRQLLAFSRKQVIAPQVINLNTVISNFSKMLHRLVGEDIELRLLCRPAIGNIKADPSQIEQVLMNLAVNAREAMSGGGQLTIATDMQRPRRHDPALIAKKDADFVMLSVADTGQGMSPEEQERIFEPFFTTKADGTGLGLATVYGIVTQHGGVVEVDSTPGYGTVFSLYFQKVEGEESPSPLQEDDPTKMVGGRETILVVDDSPELVGLLVEILSPLGYHLLGANSPQEAIRISAAMTGTIDLLLTDVVMPEMNGVELARIIAGQRPSIKMIFLSGYAENYLALADRPKEALFLEKPVLPTTLASKVREVLDGSGAAPA